jgi:hypothetical protein
MARNPLTHAAKKRGHSCPLQVRPLRTRPPRSKAVPALSPFPPLSPQALPTSPPKALDCCQHYSSRARTECASQPSQQAPKWKRASRRSSPHKPALRTSPPGSAEPQLGVFRTSPGTREAPYSHLSPPALRTSQPQALDCWENHSSLCVRSTPTSPLGTSPGTRGSVLAPLPTSPLKSQIPLPPPPFAQHTTLRSRPCPAPSRRPPIPTGLRPQHHPHISKTTFRQKLFPPCHRHHLPPDCSRTTRQPRPAIAIMARAGRNSRSKKDRMLRLTPSTP